MTETNAQLSGSTSVFAMMMNAVTRSVSGMFPGYFPEAKHNHYKDFGWPENITFEQFYAMYCRNGYAGAAVKKTARMIWQDTPTVRESEEEHEETALEAEMRQRFADLRIWQRLADADRRSMVGRYAGVILRIADSKEFKEPVEAVSGGLLALVEVIPVWEGQLKVATWQDDEKAENYGQPKMYSFTESAVGKDAGQAKRSFEVHPDRVIIWSEDGTVNGQSMFEAGYNDLLTLEKINGAGGEGFWKNAKSAPVLKMDKEARLDEMAKAMGVPKDGLVDAMNEQVADWQKGFDKVLMLQGMEADTLNVTLPSPEHFRVGPLESFAASIGIPMKILVGAQTGQRASTEDANEWAKTCMGRRKDQVIPNIMVFVNRLERFGILPERDWSLKWTDLTEASMEKKIERADKMADINQKMSKTGELVFTPEEIREAVDLEPLDEADKFREEDGLEDDAGPTNTD